MQHHARALVLSLAALASCAAAYAADGEQWEYTMSLQSPGMSIPMNTIKACHAVSSSLKPGLGENCKLEEYKRSGNTASFRAVCGPPQPSVMSGEMTRTGDTMTGTFRL
jgi:hypothetical protein